MPPLIRFLTRSLPTLLIGVVALSCGGGDSPTEVTDPPGMAVAPAALQFTAPAGSANPPMQTVQINRTGDGIVNGLEITAAYASGQPADWLLGGLSRTAAPAVLELQPDIAGLPVGNYSAIVTIHSAVNGVADRTVNVTLAVTGTPVMTVAPAAIDFAGTAGGANPAAKTAAVSNSGTGTLSGLSANVTCASGQPTGWLVAQLSGTSAPATLTLSPTIGTLAPGTYTCTVTIVSALAGVASKQVAVTFVVSAAAAISVSPSSVGFSASVGGANPAAQNVQITNGGSGSLAGLAASIGYASGQPTGWLSRTLASTAAPAQLALQATTGSLAAGTYNATVRVTSTSPGVASVDIPVTFVVSAQQAFTLAVTASPASGGTVSRTPSQATYAPGTSVSISASPVTGWEFTGWTGDLVSSANPASITMNANKSVTAGFALRPPVLTASASGGTVSLSWTYTWPCTVANCLVSSADHYRLEESTTSATSGFAQIYQSPMNDHSSPFATTLSRAPGTYYYRVRASTVAGFSQYSAVKTVTVAAQAMELTAIAQFDNAIATSTTDATLANRVFSNSDLAVGCDFAIGPFTSDFICFATALKFNVQSQISGRSIKRAVLRLHPRILPADIGTTYRLSAFATDWNPATFTFNAYTNTQVFTSGRVQVTPPVTTAVPLEFDVTTIVRNWANGTWPNLGVVIEDMASTFPTITLLRTTYFNSLEVFSTASRRPTLFIEFQ